MTNFQRSRAVTTDQDISDISSSPPLFSNRVHILVTDDQAVILTFTYQPPMESTDAVEPPKIQVSKICLTKDYFETMLFTYLKDEAETSPSLSPFISNLN